MNDVHGAANDVFYTSPATTALVPEDLSVFTLPATSMMRKPPALSSGTYAGNKDGTFTIPSLPSGPFYLLVIAPNDPLPWFYQTSSHVLDLGVSSIGRPDARVAIQPTVSTFHLSGLDTIQSEDAFFVSSVGTGEGSELDSSVPSGVMSIDSTIDWKGRRLLDATKGDELFVVHMRSGIDDPDVSKLTVVDGFSTRSVTLVDGQPATVTGMFHVPTTSAKLDVFMDPASFVQGLDHPSHQPVKVGLRLRSTPDGGSRSGSSPSRSFGLFVCSRGSPSPSPTSIHIRRIYRDPFP